MATQRIISSGNILSIFLTLSKSASGSILRTDTIFLASYLDHFGVFSLFTLGGPVKKLRKQNFHFQESVGNHGTSHLLRSVLGSVQNVLGIVKSLLSTLKKFENCRY